MSTVANNKKFINLENVKVYHNRKDNTIQIISNDDDLIGKPFQITLNQGTETEATLRELLTEKGIIQADESNPFLSIPKFAPYPAPECFITAAPDYTAYNTLSQAHTTEEPSQKKTPPRTTPWNEIPLGLGENSAEITFNVEASPHTLISGLPGAGKSIVQQSFLFHCLKHPENWEFYGIDLKQVELKPYKQFPKTVLSIATTLGEAVALIKKIKTTMMDRYAEMEEVGANNFRELSNGAKKPPKAIMLMVDELAPLLTCTPSMTRSETFLHEAALNMLTDISTLGRAAGIYLVLATKNPSTGVFTNELMNNLETRIAVGRMSLQMSQIVLKSKGALATPGLKGRTIIRSYSTKINGETSTTDEVSYQTYFLPFDKLNEVFKPANT